MDVLSARPIATQLCLGLDISKACYVTANPGIFFVGSKTDR